MTLPFDTSDNNKRKYQCFVCGVAFEDFELFKNHIFDNHEKGRDYVVCPLSRCGAPVRDLRSHFKCKHPTEKLQPVAGPIRSLIWKDVNPKTGKTKTKKPKFRQGWYESIKMNKKMHYKSGYECLIYELLDQLNEITAFEVEPFEIPYLHENEMHNYLPDLFVQYIDGRKEVWEIKPANQTHLEINQNKWDAAAKACNARGWKFIVQTEKGINQLKKKVKQQHNVNE